MTIALARTSPPSALARRPLVNAAAPRPFVQRPDTIRVKALPTPPKPPRIPACGALDALQTLPVQTSPNFFTSVLLAVVTLGALPALLWPLRFRRSVDADRRALLELAKWGRGRVSDADARQLVEAANRVRFAPSLMTLGMLGVVSAIGAVAWGITQISPQHDLLSWLLGLTYGSFWPRFSAVAAEAPISVFAIWTIGLTVAYSAHLVQVHLYAHSLRRFLDEFNRLSIAKGYTPVLLDPIGFGVSPWALAAAALLMLSGGWAVPLAFAGATDCRLRRRALPRMRKCIVGRVRDIIFARTRPSDRTPALTRCDTGGCGRPLGKGVKFCPRCGVKAATALDRWI